MHPELTVFLLDSLPLLLIIVPLVGAAAVRSSDSPAVGFATTTLTVLLASLLVIAVGQSGDVTVQAAFSGYHGTGAAPTSWTLNMALLATPFSSFGVWLIALIALLTVVAIPQPTVTLPAQSPLTVLPGFLVLQAAITGFVLAADLVLVLLFGSMISVVLINWLRQNPALSHVTVTGWLGFVLAPNVPMALAAVLAYGLADSAVSATSLPIPTSHGGSSVLLGLLVLGFGLRLPVIPAMAELQRHVPALAQPLLTAGGVLMAGHGLYHFGTPLLPLLSPVVLTGLLTLTVLLMIYGGLRAWVERDLYRLLGAITVVQMGFIGMGLFAQETTATTGAILHTLNSTVITAALGFCFYSLNRRFGTIMMDELGGLASSMPNWTAFLALFAFAVLGLPGTSAFVGELLIVLGTVHFHPLMAATALIGMFLTGVYSLNLIRRMTSGTPYRVRRTAVDLSTPEQVILVPLAVLVIGIGLFPHVLMTLLGHSLPTHLAAHLPGLALTMTP